MLLRTVIGDTLRRIRNEQGRTLREVARTARVSVPYLSEIERGRKEVSSEILAAVCRALDITLSSLLLQMQLHSEVLDNAAILDLKSVHALQQAQHEKARPALAPSSARLRAA